MHQKEKILPETMKSHTHYSWYKLLTCLSLPLLNISQVAITLDYRYHPWPGRAYWRGEVGSG